MAHRLAPLAERDLDDVWLYVAKEGGSIVAATFTMMSVEPGINERRL